jgi:hypothetical protein
MEWIDFESRGLNLFVARASVALVDAVLLGPSCTFPIWIAHGTEEPFPRLRLGFILFFEQHLGEG